MLFYKQTGLILTMLYVVFIAFFLKNLRLCANQFFCLLQHGPQFFVSTPYIIH